MINSSVVLILPLIKRAGQRRGGWRAERASLGRMLLAGVRSANAPMNSKFISRVGMKRATNMCCLHFRDFIIFYAMQRQNIDACRGMIIALKKGSGIIAMIGFRRIE